jgi:hypothetical protein
MLNLLVGILSEKLGDIITNRTISEYKLLLELCIDNETFRQFFLNFKKIDYHGHSQEGSHLVFGTGHEEHENWEGQVNAIKEETMAIRD